jgi:predicted nucleotidyltransferase
MTDKTLSPAHVILSQEQLEAFCQRHQVRKLSLFGSVLRDDFNEGSDIDVLVEFEPEAKPTLIDLARMRFEFEELTGREVDLMTAGFLSRYFRQQVIDSALVLYEKVA